MKYIFIAVFCLITHLSSAQCDSLDFSKLNRYQSKQLRKVIESNLNAEVKKLKVNFEYTFKTLKETHNFEIDKLKRESRTKIDSMGAVFKAHDKFLKLELRKLEEFGNQKADSLRYVTKQYRIAHAKRIKSWHWILYGISITTTFLIGIWIRNKLNIFKLPVIKY